MIVIEYKRIKGQIIVREDKLKEKAYSATPETVNVQALNFVKSYFVRKIKKLCKERINVMNHIVYRDDLNKKEFFLKVLAGIEYAMRQPTWDNYLFTCLKNLRDYAPNRTSRYYPNYILRVEQLKKVFDWYSDTDIYYFVRAEQLVLDLFDIQPVTNDYLS